MQTSKENSKTPETKGTQVAPKRTAGELDATTEQRNKGNSNSDQTNQKPRPATGKQEDVDEEENEESNEENTVDSELDSEKDQPGKNKNSQDPTRTGNNNPNKNSDPNKRNL